MKRVVGSLAAAVFIAAGLITSGALLTVSAPSLAGAATAHSYPALSAPLLPGEPTLSGGSTGYTKVPAYDFGLNNGIEYGNSTGTEGFAEDPTAQVTVKSAGLKMDRLWAPYEPVGTLMDSGDVTWLTDHINAAKNSGMTCYMEMGDVDNLPILEQEVTMAESLGCHIFEFGNEVDSHSNNSMTTYVQQWNVDIPQLRALSVCAGVTPTVTTGCLFGGPTVADPWDGIPTFLQGLNKSNAMPDFISYHIYPCSGAEAWDSTTTLSQEDCIEATGLPASQCTNNVNNCDYTSIAYMQQEVLGWEQQYLGKLLPTGVSETNWDPGTSTMTDWGNDDSFLSYYAQAEEDTAVANHFSFNMTYTAEDSAGYGYLDLLCDSAGYNNDSACTAQGAPKGEFVGIACEAALYGASSTFVAPAAVASDSDCSPSNIGNWQNWIFPSGDPTTPPAGASVRIGIAKRVTSGIFTGCIAMIAGTGGPAPPRVTYSLDGHTYAALGTWFGYFDLVDPPPSGTYSVTATATYANGSTVTSAPVSLTVP